MIDTLLRIASTLMKRNFFLIDYKKIGNAPSTSVGYLDIEEVKKRYLSSGRDTRVWELKKQTPVRDALFFINENSKIIDKDIKSGKLLDVGCGNGLYSKLFSEKECPFKKLEYYGTEICDEFVDVCKQVNPDKTFFKSFAQSIAARENEYKVVYCSSTLHYTLKDWRKTISELSRVCKKYIFIMRHPVTKYSKTFYVKQTVRTKTGTENHYFVVINRGDLEKEFEKNGLKIVSRDYSSEEYRIEGVEEKIVLCEYLLSK